MDNHDYDNLEISQIMGLELYHRHKPYCKCCKRHDFQKFQLLPNLVVYASWKRDFSDNKSVEDYENLRICDFHSESVGESENLRICDCEEIEFQNQVYNALRASLSDLLIILW